MSTEEQKWVPLGKISGVFGVKGWMKIFSNTQPKENILTYSPWYLKREGKWQAFEVVDGKGHGKGVIAQIAGCTDRDIAAGFIGTEIFIKREQLPETAPGEYYWSDLTGLKVVNLEGIDLGTVDSMLETGANDVMVVQGPGDKGKKKRERLIPYLTDQVIREVNLEQGVITVDWDADF